MRVSFNQPRRIEFLTQVRESVGLMGRISRRNKTEFEINSVSSAQGVIVVGLYEIFASEILKFNVLSYFQQFFHSTVALT